MLVRVQDIENEGVGPIIVTMKGDDRFASQPVRAFVIEAEDAVASLADDKGCIAINPRNCTFTEITIH
jgi:hypothetical protein